MICLESCCSSIKNSSSDRFRRQKNLKNLVISKVLTVQGKPKNLLGAREFAAKLARKCGFSDDDIFDIKVAVSEALTNAILHGSPCGRNNFVQVVFLCNHRKMRIVIIDEGTFSPKNTVQQEEAECGRGLDLISYFMDFVSVNPSPSGTSVTMIKDLYQDKKRSA